MNQGLCRAAMNSVDFFHINIGKYDGNLFKKYINDTFGTNKLAFFVLIYLPYNEISHISDSKILSFLKVPDG